MGWGEVCALGPDICHLDLEEVKEAVVGCRTPLVKGQRRELVSLPCSFWRGLSAWKPHLFLEALWINYSATSNCTRTLPTGFWAMPVQ